MRNGAAPGKAPRPQAAAKGDDVEFGQGKAEKGGKRLHDGQKAYGLAEGGQKAESGGWMEIDLSKPGNLVAAAKHAAKYRILVVPRSLGLDLTRLVKEPGLKVPDAIIDEVVPDKGGKGILPLAPKKAQLQKRIDAYDKKRLDAAKKKNGFVAFFEGEKYFATFVVGHSKNKEDKPVVVAGPTLSFPRKSIRKEKPKKKQAPPPKKIPDMPDAKDGPFGAASIRLVAPGGASASRQGKGAPQAPQAADKLTVAPSAESLKIEIALKGEPAKIQHARVELHSAKPGGKQGPLWARNLTAAEKKAKATIAWEGKVEKSTLFPEGFVTAEHSPYKLLLRVAGGDPEEAWTFFRVEVHSLALERPTPVFGCTTLDEVGVAVQTHIPKPGEEEIVPVTANLFRHTPEELETDAPVQYMRRKWGDGPRIPIFAAVQIKNSQGKGVDAPGAIGGLKFLWDWECVDPPLSKLGAAQKAFVDAAQSYDAQKTLPPGKNCHVDRGGKRGPGAKPVFPEEPGYGPQKEGATGWLPFTVTRCQKRSWCAFSTAWGSGKFAGRTGITFQPSVMAGDGFKLTVRAAPEPEKLDVATPGVPKGSVMAQTGTFRVHRIVSVTKYVRKNGGIPAAKLADVRAHFAGAFLKIVRFVYTRGRADESFSPIAFDPKKYDDTIKTWAGRLVATFQKAAIDMDRDQSETGAAVVCRDWDGWKKRMLEVKGYTKATVEATMKERHLHTRKHYLQACYDYAEVVYNYAAGSLIEETEGINIVQFNRTFNHEKDCGLWTNGVALERPEIGPTRGILYLFMAGDKHPGESDDDREQVTAHEMGHLLFLPHAPYTGKSQATPSRARPDMHDAGDPHCLMGYRKDKERHFCGMCLLRLRGWDVTRMKNQAAQNRR